MALRIGGGKAPLPPEEVTEESPMPTEEAMGEEEIPVEEAPEVEEAGGGGILDPTLVSYRGPEQGPFACGNCQYFQPAGEPNTCLFVSGNIDEGGLCNLFTALPQEEVPEEEPMEAPIEEPLPEEAPIEEAPEELPAEE